MASAKSLGRRSSVALALLLWLLAGGQAHAQVGRNGEVDGLTAKFVDVNGVKTRYYDYGEGDTIVLAGVGSSGANLWSRNIRALARKFRVLAVDELGDGMTDAPKDDNDFGMVGQVEHLYQFMRVDPRPQAGHDAGNAHREDAAPMRDQQIRLKAVYELRVDE